MTIEQAIKHLQNISKESLNDEQKKLAKQIIEKTAINGEVNDKVLQFIEPNIKCGFIFDKAPEVQEDNIALLKEETRLKINGSGTNKQEHFLIIGENYEVLKNLKISHTKIEHGKRVGLIDVIYIDPPYNTEKCKEDGNDHIQDIQSSKFIYRDKFKRTGWLNMMNERLKLAYDLLSDDGVIFISIDDNEQAYLKVLCDEIFGEEHFLFCAPRITKKGGKSTKTIQKNNDYIIAYSKSMDLIFSQMEKEDIAKYKYEDEFVNERGKYALTQTLDYDSLQYNETMDYEIEFEGKKFYPGGSKEEMEKRHNGKHNTTDWVWRWSKSAVEWGIKNNLIVLKNNRLYTKSYLYCRKVNGKNELEKIDATKAYTTLSFIENKFSNDNAKKELDNIFDDESIAFSYPKPSLLISTLIKMVCTKKDAIILDFFAGSGTTGQAVAQLNISDKGTRKFILCTNNENNIGLNITRERLYRIINGKGTNGKTIKWEYSDDLKSLINNDVRVFSIKHYPCGINENPDELCNLAKKELVKLNPSLEIEDIQLNRQLSSLHPYVISKESELKEEK